LSDSGSNGFLDTKVDRGLVFTDMSFERNELDYSLDY